MRLLKSSPRLVLVPFVGTVFAACASAPPPSAPAPIDPVALTRTLEDLAAFGEKRVGTPGGANAAQYIRERMHKMNLGNIHDEVFSFPRFDLQSSSLVATIDGADMPIGHDVFEASGSGHADGDLVYVGTAQDKEVAGKDLTGKIAIVDRSPTYHRSKQLANVVAKNALAMLYVSAAPENLRQVGSVRWSWEISTKVPAITVGADDGAKLKDAVSSGKKAHAVIDVQAVSTPATGQNIVGMIEGSDPSAGQIVIGAHYDTWFAGSTDNGSGVAAMLAFADRRMHKERPGPTILFVAYDGEEVALFGGYDFLRKHRVVQDDKITLVINFEIPSSRGANPLGVARSNEAGLDDALRTVGMNELYNTYVTFGVVPALFGGIIPTDIQGIYRSGVPTISTAAVGPYYHTTQDTPDKVDPEFLAQAVEKFDRALELILAQGPTCCADPDTDIWTADFKARPRAPGGSLFVDATVKNSAGAPRANAAVEFALLVDDFTPASIKTATTDAAGNASMEFSAADADKGAGEPLRAHDCGRDLPARREGRRRALVHRFS